MVKTTALIMLFSPCICFLLNQNISNGLSDLLWFEVK